MSSTFDDLLVALGFDYDPEAAEKFSKDLDGLVGLAVKAGKAVVGATAAVIGFTVATTAASDEQGKLADEIGVAVNQIDALQFANRRAGGSADGMSASLHSLSGKIGEAARGTGSGIEAFGMLGVEVQDATGQLKSADKVLLEVAGRMQDFSKGQQIELAEKLGLSGSIRLLQQGRNGISELVAEAEALGTTTAEDAALSAQFQDSLTDIWQIVKQVSRVLARNLVPILEKTANTFTEWWKTNKDIIAQNVPEYLDKVVHMIKLLTLGVSAFIALKLATTLFTLINLFKGLSMWAMAANVAVMALPILIGSIIAGIALLAEDAKVFFDGGESFIGKMIDKYPEWETQLVAVAAVFATLHDLTTRIFDGWGKIFDFFSTGTIIEDFKMVVQQIGLDIAQLFSDMGDQAEAIFDRALQRIKDRIADSVNVIKGLWSFDDFKNPFDNFKNPFSSFLNDDFDATVNVGLVPDDTLALDKVFNPVADFFSANSGDNQRMPLTIGSKFKDEANAANTSSLYAGSKVKDEVGIANTSPLYTSSKFKDEVDATSIGQDKPRMPDIVVQNFAKNPAAAGNSTTSNSNQNISEVDNSVSSAFSTSDTYSNTSSTNTTTLSGDINIRVDGSDAPELTAKAIHEELKNLIEQSSINLNTSVDI